MRIFAVLNMDNQTRVIFVDKELQLFCAVSYLDRMIGSNHGKACRRGDVRNFAAIRELTWLVPQLFEPRAHFHAANVCNLRILHGEHSCTHAETNRPHLRPRDAHLSRRIIHNALIIRCLDNKGNPTILQAICRPSRALTVALTCHDVHLLRNLD